MIAYNKKDLDHTYLLEEAQDLKNAGFVTSDQLKEIKTKFQGLKQNKNILLRIVFVFLGALAYASICGFLALIYFESKSSSSFSENFFAILCAIVGFVGVEILIKQKQFGYGIDDAFLISAQIALLIFLGMLFDYRGELPISIGATIITCICFLRYLHVLTALCFAISLSLVFAYSSLEIGGWAQNFLPFTMMALAVAIYFLSKKYLGTTTKIYYNKGIKIINTYSLVLFYFSGNYLVVRQLSEELLRIEVMPQNDIPFAYFFYFFTFAIPVLYIYRSLIKKDRIMLWVGILTFCFSIYSFRYYHHVLPPEVGLTLGGVMLFTFTYFAIKKLEHKESGITFMEDKFDDSERLANLETLIATAQTGIKPQSQGSSVELGGGEFGGGGSGSEF